MKTQTLFFSMAALLLASCSGGEKKLEVTVANPLSVERVGEFVELPVKEVTARLQLSDASRLLVQDAQGAEVPYQQTYDQKIIFPVSVKASAEATYTLREGTPSKVDTTACGKVHPERMDDLAWENDLVGFRAYGPTLQARGERGFGYDLFVKRGTTEPVLDKMYAMETDQETWKRIDELKKSDPVAAEELRKTITYHVDRGYGMDCYAVGPTLGAGVAALVQNDTIVYPWCYKEYEILDNGPLRFTAKLQFTPLNVAGRDDVIETRVITLDQGSQLNRTDVSYTSLTQAMPIAAGIVLHNTDGAVATEAEGGYISYVDPTTGPNQGEIFVGAAFPAVVKEAKVQLFSPEEKKQRNNADGHVLAVGEYEPGSTFTYYWGFAWNRADNIKNADAWNEYLEQFALRVRNPLKVTIK